MLQVLKRFAASNAIAFRALIWMEQANTSAELCGFWLKLKLAA